MRDTAGIETRLKRLARAAAAGQPDLARLKTQLAALADAIEAGGDRGAAAAVRAHSEDLTAENVAITIEAAAALARPVPQSPIEEAAPLPAPVDEPGAAPVEAAPAALVDEEIAAYTADPELSGM